MDFDKINKLLIGEPAFRVQQVARHIWRDLIEDWSGATTLSKELRAKLAEGCSLEIKAEVFPDKDGPSATASPEVRRAGRSAKALITLEDGLSVETVLMRHDGRNTVCVSSQIGCPLGCSFCATGQMGFKRNLSTGEIEEQVLFWARYLKKEGERLSNMVFMGMGEPFLNYDNVFAAIKALNDDNLLGIGARHISISTAGVIEGMERMAEDMPQINLAISLHAPNDELRQKLMPIAKKYPLANLMAAAEDYVGRTNRKLMFEYIMIKGVNDSDEHAKELAKLLSKRLFFVNLIAYNQTGDFVPSSPAQIKRFKDILMKGGVQALERYRFGQDIKGACGQLAGK
ncbi:MAG TPA: 23S rRNA (adenine(2503)-C(2))-methyltransferase RlmN [Candidatus Portnoybacteria bacterium]|nr:23S rRNA (adenine(2503)-C(2))-methyltransferase RlmN [Candidatus Portnoybacteria bacterium]